MTSKTDEEIAEKAIMSLRFHPNLEDQVKCCDPGNINVILEAIRESKSAARQDTERLDWLDQQVGLQLLTHREPQAYVHEISRNMFVEAEHPDLRHAIDNAMARCELNEGELKEMPTKEDIHKLRGIFKETEPHKAEDASKEKNGIALIAAERQRQISVEGWTPEHDDTHADGELAVEAARWAAEGTDITCTDNGLCGTAKHRKSKPRLRRIVIAGALIAAEIDRLLRKESDPKGADSVVADGSSTGGGVSSPDPASVQERSESEAGSVNPK